MPDHTLSTDSDGETSIDLSDGEYELSFSADGYNTSSETVTIDGSDESLAASLDPSFSYSAPSDADYQIETDSDGRADFGDIEEGDYDWEAGKHAVGEATGETDHDSEQEISVTLSTSDTEHSVTIRVVDHDGDAIEGADVTFDGESASTDSDGEVEFLRTSGEYDLEISAEGTTGYSDTVTISGASKTVEVGLLPTYDAPTEYDYQGTTDSEGLHVFDDLATRDYDVEAGLDEYEVYESTFSHLDNSDLNIELIAHESEEEREEDDDPIGPGTDDPVDPRLSLPDTPAHFEVTPLSEQADDSFRVPILVCNAGGNRGSTAIRLKNTETDRLVYRSTVELAPAGYQIVWMGVRSQFEQSPPISLRVVTNDDEARFDLSFSSSPREVIGIGNPATMGGELPATMGGALPATMGRRRDPPTFTVEEDLARRKNGWAITLENPGGERKHLEIISDEALPDPERHHTQLSNWTADVPADPELHEWTYNSRVWLTFDERLVFTGWLNTAESAEGATTLMGHGPAGELDKGSYEFDLNGLLEWRAIERVIAGAAPEWDWHVVRPDDSVSVYDKTISGTALECITQICEETGMRYLIDQRKFRRGIVFPPGGVVSDPPWDPEMVADVTRERSMEGYANHAEVLGAERSEGSGKYQGEYTNDEEISRLAAELGITDDEATETHPIRDPTIESDREAHARAQSSVRDRVENRDVSGSFDIPAQLVEPGLQYPMPWDDDLVSGNHSMFFSGDGYVVLPREIRTKMTGRGAITLWTRAKWSELDDRETRLFGTFVEDHAEADFRTVDPESLTFAAKSWGRDRQEVSAYPDDPPPDDEWIHLGYDWNVQGQPGSIMRAATSEGIVDEGHIEGTGVRIPIRIYLGRHRADYFIGAIAGVSLWDRPLTGDEYQTLAAGGQIPGDHLIAHFPMHEGSGNIVHDVFGGHHGEATNTQYIGNPQSLEEVTIADGVTTLDFVKRQTPRKTARDLIREVKRLQR